MPTTNFDCSMITNRRQNRAAAGTFINRIQNTTNPALGYGNPNTGNYNGSVIPEIKSGHTTQYIKNNTCVTVSQGCPCIQTINNYVPPPIEIYYGWATPIDNGPVTSIASNLLNQIYTIGIIQDNPVTFYNFSTLSSGIFTKSSYGTIPFIDPDTDTYISLYNSLGQVQWVTTITGSLLNQPIYVTTDSVNNAYLIGYTDSSPVTINNFSTVSSGIILASTFGTLSTSNIDLNSYIVKYNNLGQAQWATNIQNNNTTLRAITTDTNNNVYVTGSVLGVGNNLYINSFSTVSSAVILTSTFGELITGGFYSNFLTKYNSSGQAQWATSIQGFSDTGIAVTTDSLNNVYVLDYGSSNPITIRSFSTVSSGIILQSTFATLSSFSNNDIRLLKYNSAGQAQWGTTMGGPGFDVGFRMTNDRNDNIYLYGYTLGSNPLTIRSFSTISSSYIVQSTFGVLSSSNQAFVVKYNSNGQAQWATNIRGANNNTAAEIKVDSLNNVYINVASDSSPLYFNNFNTVSSGIIITSPFGQINGYGNSDAYTAKLNSSGTFQWVNNFGGEENDANFSLTIDQQNNVIIGGNMNSSVLTINSFNTISSNIILTSTVGILQTNTSGFNQFNGFLIKFDSNGKLIVQ